MSSVRDTDDRPLDRVAACVDLGHGRCEMLTHQLTTGTRSRCNVSIRLQADQPGTVRVSEYPLRPMVKLDALAQQLGVADAQVDEICSKRPRGATAGQAVASSAMLSTILGAPTLAAAWAAECSIA